jgi:hypothetical protein
MELSYITTGRHYHLSCCLDNKLIYHIGAIKNADKKYVNSIFQLRKLPSLKAIS